MASRERAASADLVRELCLALPGATVEQTFGSGADVFRVHRKMFALLGSSPRVSERPYANLEADLQEVPLLVGTHGFVLPGFHMSKKHRGSVVLAPGTDTGLLEELVEDPYDHVVSGLPARLRSSLGRSGSRGSSAVDRRGRR